MIYSLLLQAMLYLIPLIANLNLVAGDRPGTKYIPRCRPSPPPPIAKELARQYQDSEIGWHTRYSPQLFCTMNAIIDPSGYYRPHNAPSGLCWCEDGNGDNRGGPTPGTLICRDSRFMTPPQTKSVNEYCGAHCTCPSASDQTPIKVKYATTSFFERIRLDQKVRMSESGAVPGEQEMERGRTAASCRAQMYCTSNAECGQNVEGREGCGESVCQVLRRTKQAVIEMALCVTREFLAMGVARGSNGGFGRRSIGEVECACNATHISKECCWEENGMV